MKVDDRDTPTLPSSPSALRPVAVLHPPYDLRIAVLAWRFPSLSWLDGIHPWDPKRLVRALLMRSHPAAALHSARFVLSVWNPAQVSALGAFDMHQALAAWDDAHRAAFAEWATAPWWP